MRCCLMVFLLKVLSDIAPKSSATSFIQICPNPTFQLGPTEISYPEPPSSFGLSHCQTLTNWIHQYGSRSHRDGLANSLLLVAITSVPPRGCNRCHRDEVCPKHCTSVHPRCSSRSHRDS